MEKFFFYFFVFYVGSFLGFLLEEGWCFIRHHKFLSRKGLIYEPIIPIYGVASLFIFVLARKVKYQYLAVFLIGMVVATIVEYLSSYLQEVLFHTKSWDYSNMPFNLHGRVNMLYSIGFGLAAMFFIRFLGKLSRILAKFSSLEMLKTIIVFLIVFFFVDVFISLIACIRHKHRRENNAKATFIGMWLDKMYPDERIDKIFNNAKVISL